MERTHGSLLVDAAPNYDEEYLAQLFDRMGPTYDVVNVVTSFGLCNRWRRQCVENLTFVEGAVVADLMAGSGECWPYLLRGTGSPGQLISIDFSRVMNDRQRDRVRRRALKGIEIRNENVLGMNLPDESVHYVVSAFGLKTFNEAQWDKLAKEVHRILKPGGQFSFLEISTPKPGIFRGLYELYVGRIIPVAGRLFLGDIDCYRMLGVYTKAFGNCERVIEPFRGAGLTVQMRSHFFGCATSIFGTKP